MPHAALVIVNPAAGAGRGLRMVPWLRERLAARPTVDLRVTGRPGDAEAWAGEARSGGHERVVAVGGDGTVQEVVNGLLAGARHEPAALGIVPVGRGNDLARSLGLPSGADPALVIALDGPTQSLDVGRAVNGQGTARHFASAGGIGFDAQVAAAMARRRGWAASRAGYLLTTLGELRRFRNRAVVVTVDGERIARDVLFVAFANGAYYGGGMRIAPSARSDDGRFDVCVVGDISRLTAVRQLPNLYRGTHIRHPAVTEHVGSLVEISGDVGTHIHIDGEPFGTLPLTVTVLPGALRVAAGARPVR